MLVVKHSLISAYSRIAAMNVLDNKPFDIVWPCSAWHSFLCAKELFIWQTKRR